MSNTERPQLTEEILRKLPKVDLHRHLDGSVRVETILDLAAEQDIELPTHDLDELRKLVTVDNDCESLEDYLVGFGIVNMVTQKPYALTRIFFEACEDAVADGLKYVEIRFAPILHVNENMQLSQVMEAVCEGQAMAEYHLPIKARIILCGMRHMEPETTMAVAELAWRYRNRGVVAFDLAGPESGFSSVRHKDAFELVRKQMLKMTVHSGEAAGPESILDSIRYCGAHRIGHGTTLGQDPELLDYVVDRGIALEVCPTSNLQTKAVSALDSHPMVEYVKAGVRIVVCTDNPRISQVTLSSELLVCHEVMGMDLATIVSLIDNGFRSTFLERGLRKRMRADALYQTYSILRSEGFDVSPIVNDPHYYPAAVNFTKDLGAQYWGLAPQPAITRQLIHELPKIDVHVRLSGSASLPLVWKNLTAAAADPSLGIDLGELLGVEAPAGADDGWMPDYELFVSLIQRESHTKASMNIAKAAFNAALQTEDAIRSSVADIFEQAAAENYLYLELVIAPQFHTVGGLSYEAFVSIVVDAVQASSAASEVQAGIIVGVSLSPTKRCDPVECRKIAELAVQFRHSGVAGFGAYGSVDLAPDYYQFYKSSFNYLKDNSMSVVMCAGSQSPETVLSALSEGGAARVSGGFQIHKQPNLFNYVADLGVPLELGMTDKLELHTSDTGSFTPSPVSLFMDNEISVTLCSFRGSVYPQCLSDDIFELVEKANINIAYLLKLMSGGLESVFAPKAVRTQLAIKFWSQATRVAHEHGLVYLLFAHHMQVPTGGDESYQYGVFDTNAPVFDPAVFMNTALLVRGQKEADHTGSGSDEVASS